LYNVKFWEEPCTTPPSSITDSKLDVTVLGRDRFGTESAPTEFGTFDAELVLDAAGQGLLRPETPTRPVHVDVCVDCEGNRLAKKLVSPGSQVAIELRMMRRIRDDTNRVFAIFPARLPMRGILTGRFEGLEFRISVPPLILECNVA